MKEAKQVKFLEESFTDTEGWRHDDWLQFTLETGEIVSIPGNYLIQKCKKCGEIKRPYGLQGQCKECETKERK